MALGPDEVEQIARLARLAVGPDERETYARELSPILDLIEQMQAVDTQGVEPLAHPLDIAQRLRHDRVTESNRREHLQQGAPRTEDGLYLVPKVID